MVIFVQQKVKDHYPMYLFLGSQYVYNLPFLFLSTTSQSVHKTVKKKLANFCKLGDLTFFF
jgi:hypothetical protein